MKFVQVKESELQALQSVVSSWLPHSAGLWNVLKMYERNLFSKNVTTTFYTLDGIINESSVVACLQRREFPVLNDLVVNIYCDCNSTPHIQPEAVEALEDIINWSVEVVFAGVEVMLAEKLKLTELCTRNGTLHHTTPCDTFYMPKAVAELDFGAAPGTVLRSLYESEAQNVVSSWKFAGHGSLERVMDKIKTMGSGAVAVKEQDGGQKLVTWVVASHDGTMGALHTLDGYRGKGYAKLATKLLCKVCLDRQGIPLVHIEPYNEASKILMENIGFKFAHNNMWVIFNPPNQ